jgi:hypothetical protein
MERDKYFSETIHNVYYDSEFDELIQASIEKPPFKEKLRLRTYETDDGQIPDYAFIENKCKYLGVVYKRRITIPLADANRLLNGEPPGPILGTEQIAKEMLFLMQRTRIKPKLYLSYRRHSYLESGNGDLRLTFDSDIRSRYTDLGFRSAPCDKPLLAPGQRLMEIKTGYGLPVWIRSVLTANKIFPTSFSKYGNVYENRVTNELKSGMRIEGAAK